MKMVLVRAHVWTNLQLTPSVVMVHLRLISSQPNKVLVYCADINKITAKKKSAYSALTSAQKKANAAKRKRTQEGNKSLNQDYPKKVESVKRLENKITELERTVVLLTQPAPRHS